MLAGQWEGKEENVWSWPAEWYAAENSYSDVEGDCLAVTLAFCCLFSWLQQELLILGTEIAVLDAYFTNTWSTFCLMLATSGAEHFCSEVEWKTSFASHRPTVFLYFGLKQNNCISIQVVLESLPWTISTSHKSSNWMAKIAMHNLNMEDTFNENYRLNRIWRGTPFPYRGQVPFKLFCKQETRKVYSKACLMTAEHFFCIARVVTDHVVQYNVKPYMS